MCTSSYSALVTRSCLSIAVHAAGGLFLPCARQHSRSARTVAKATTELLRASLSLQTHCFLRVNRCFCRCSAWMRPAARKCPHTFWQSRWPSSNPGSTWICWIPLAPLLPSFGLKERSRRRAANLGYPHHHLQGSPRETEDAWCTFPFSMLFFSPGPAK